MTRLHIILPEDLKLRLNKTVPKGIRSSFGQSAITIAVEAMEEYGPGFLGLMLAGDVVFKPSHKALYGQNLTDPDKGG